MAKIITTSMTASFATTFSKLNVTSPSIFIINNDSASDPSKTSFKTEELNFFDPELPIEYSSKNVIKTGKDTIYRSVHLFI